MNLKQAFVNSDINIRYRNTPIRNYYCLFALGPTVRVHLKTHKLVSEFVKYFNFVSDKVNSSGNSCTKVIDFQLNAFSLSSVVECRVNVAKAALTIFEVLQMVSVF